MAARWISAGAAEAGACHIAYEDYEIGRPSASPVSALGNVPFSGPLDSIGTWGLTCQDGRLRRQRSVGESPLRRTGAPCYADRTDDVVCEGTFVPLR